MHDVVGPRSSSRRGRLRLAEVVSLTDEEYGRFVNLKRLVMILAALAVAVVVLAHFRPFFHDDGYISLRYAERLASGHGLTWNDGERVEGFSNPLLVLVAAAASVVGLDTVTAVRVLGVLSVFALGWLWRREAANVWFLALIVTNAGLARWAWGGLETAPFALLCCSATLHLRRMIDGDPAPVWLVATELVALSLMRPEGIGVAFPVALATAWLDRPRGLRLVLVVIGGYAGLLLCRYAYFGEVISNASIAKLDGVSVVEQCVTAWAAMRSQLAVWLPLVIVCLISIAVARPRARDLLVLLVPAAAPVSVNFVGGGDHIAGLRFLVPGLAVLATATAMTRIGSPRKRHTIAALVALAIVVQVHAAYNEDPRPTLTPALGASVGQFLAEQLPPGTTVALATAGSVPYYAPALTFIDTLGLNDRHIARQPTGEPKTRWQVVVGHRKGDGAYVLSRSPDVIVLGPVTGDLGRNPRAWFLTDYELLQSAEFRERYTPFLFRLRPVAPELVSPKSVGERVAGMAQIDLVAWLRLDSIAANKLRLHGTRLPLPAATAH